MLPFKPTGAQKRVLKEIADDMAAPHPMNRLLQGDVGSGKTHRGGRGGGDRHRERLPGGGARAHRDPGHAALLLLQADCSSKLGYVDRAAHRVESQRARRQQLKKLLAAGLVHVAVGTHALIEEDVEFKKLGLAIIDEQHRFGVHAAAAVWSQKGVHSGRAGDDRDADSAHAGADHLRRSGRFA